MSSSVSTAQTLQAQADAVQQCGATLQVCSSAIQVTIPKMPADVAGVVWGALIDLQQKVAVPLGVAAAKIQAVMPDVSNFDNLKAEMDLERAGMDADRKMMEAQKTGLVNAFQSLVNGSLFPH